MSKPKDDLYATLGVAESASPDEIQKAFRALARECHHDVAGRSRSGVMAHGSGGESALAASAVAIVVPRLRWRGSRLYSNVRGKLATQRRWACGTSSTVISTCSVTLNASP